MRIGQNPAKSVESVEQPAPVTVAVICYIPTLGGYYAESLDVLKVCLESIWQNTDRLYDLMVYDNASCQEVRSYLIQQSEAGKIQYLVLSDRNLGKAGAWNYIFGAAPGKYLCYADSDVIFYPNWLSEHLEILERYPNIGMLTGMPMWSPAEFSTATVEWAERHPQVHLERGKFLPWKAYWRHSQSLGADEEEAKQRFSDTEDLVMIDGNRRYYIGAGHFQFMARSEVLRSVLPIPSERPMGQVRLLDVALNDAGFLRLSTSEWWVQHMGNTLTGTDFSEKVGLTVNETSKTRTQASGSFWGWRPVQKLVRWIYHRSFEILYHK